LPIAQREHAWANGLHPVFEHLAPEGWLRTVQARSDGTDVDDDFGLLLRHGADCIGAIGIEPTTALSYLSSASGPLDAAVAAPRTLSGVQKKVLAWYDGKRFRAAGAADPATHIAKLQPDNLPDIVRNENLSLTLAREVLGADNVTRASVAALADIDTVALLVERFDREGDTKLRLEDFAQILGISRGRDFRGKYASSYEQAATAITENSARGRIDIDSYFRLVVFSFAIGNADAHLKNFSLLERPEGLRLSPAYDLVSTMFYAGSYDAITALEIGGRKRPLEELQRADLLDLGLAIGLPEPAATRSLDEVAKRLRTGTILNPKRRSGPDEFLARYSEVVSNQCGRLFA
jgi:serine/threonine-protein kinase HipA